MSKWTTYYNKLSSTITIADISDERNKCYSFSHLQSISIMWNSNLKLCLICLYAYNFKTLWQRSEHYYFNYSNTEFLESTSKVHTFI